MCVYCIVFLDYDSLLVYFIKVYFFRVFFSKRLYGFYVVELRIIFMYGIIINIYLIFLKIFFKDFCMLYITFINRGYLFVIMCCFVKWIIYFYLVVIIFVLNVLKFNWN